MYCHLCFDIFTPPVQLLSIAALLLSYLVGFLLGLFSSEIRLIQTTYFRPRLYVLRIIP
jgi:hypothetical protein